MKVTLLTVKQLVQLKLLTLFLCMPVMPAAAQSSEFQSASSIAAAAEQFVESQVERSNYTEIDAQAATLDPRLRLKKCSVPITTFATGNGTVGHRTSVGVRCTGDIPWTLYVPVTLNALSPIVFTKQSLLRGETYTSEALELRYLPIHEVPRDALTDIEQALGMATARNVAAESAVTLNSLRAATLISQGQEVIILAEGNGMAVRMTGKALKNGVAGEMIPIRNDSSGRTIEARIVSESTVLVSF